MISKNIAIAVGLSATHLLLSHCKASWNHAGSPPAKTCKSLEWILDGSMVTNNVEHPLLFISVWIPPLSQALCPLDFLKSLEITFSLFNSCNALFSSYLKGCTSWLVFYLIFISWIMLTDWRILLHRPANMFSCTLKCMLWDASIFWMIFQLMYASLWSCLKGPLNVIIRFRS